MKVTNRLTHIATKVNFEAAMTEDQLKAAFESKGLAGFPAMLDIKERTEEHVQMLSLGDLLSFAKASGVAAVTFDVRYGLSDYPRLKRVVLEKLAHGGQKAKRDFVLRASRAQVELMDDEDMPADIVLR